MTNCSRSTRRQFIHRAAACTAGAGLFSRFAVAAELADAHPLAPQPSHERPRAKHLVFIFLTGGFSHVDTFDPKPKLQADHKKTIEAPSLRDVTRQPLLGSPFKFTACGQSGLMMSELFAQLGSVADELCVIRSLHTDILEHFQAALAMHTGSSTVPLPSLGSWLSYGLGSFNPNLPSYLVFCEHLPYGGSQVWDSSFLPPLHQGARIMPGDEPVPNLRPPVRDVTLHELETMMLDDVNRVHAETRPDDLNLRARINSFHTARGMMRVAPQVFDLRQETEETLRLYGVRRGDRKSFGWQCLMARRLVEQGVRVVELIDTGASDNWDSHGNMQDHRPKAARVDGAITALICDLKRRGLLDETLIAICTEFGRTPWDPGLGRNHWHRAFSCLLAGGGVKGGTTYGETDEYGASIVKNPCHVHDYHATILHLMGIDHTRLTYRYAGRNFRLTDVHGRVLREILT